MNHKDYQRGYHDGYQAGFDKKVFTAEQYSYPFPEEPKDKLEELPWDTFWERMSIEEKIEALKDRLNQE